MLDAMPIPKKDVDELMSSIRTAVLQMRLSGKSRAGVSGVVMFFAICWLLAEKMQEERDLQSVISRAILLLTGVSDDGDPIDAEAYSAAMDVIDLIPEILSKVSAKEYLDCAALIKDDVTIDRMDVLINKEADAIEAERAAVRPNASHEEAHPAAV